MKTNTTCKNLLLPTLLSLTLVGALTVRPAHAQGMNNDKIGSGDASTKDLLMLSMDELDDLDFTRDMNFPTDPERNVYVDPLEINYPFASPGQIDTYHYVDYSKTAVAPGSVDEIRTIKYHALWRKAHKMMMMMNGDNMDKMMFSAARLHRSNG